MHWYAWVLGPPEFVAAWWLIRSPRWCSWVAIKKWFADFNSYDPLPGPVFMQQQMVQQAHNQIYGYPLVRHAAEPLTPQMVASLRSTLKKFPENYQPLVDRWGTSWIGSECWDCGRDFSGPTGRCPECAENFENNRRRRAQRPPDFGGPANTLGTETSYRPVLQNRYTPTEQTAIEQGCYVETRDATGKEIVATYRFPPVMRALPPSGERWDSQRHWW
jgi:hypothetical protein